MTVFRKSLKVVNSYLIYIPVLALSGLMIWSESTRLYALLSALLSFIIYPIIYGRIVETIKEAKRSSWTDLLVNYFARYLGLTLIFIVPIFVLNPLYSDWDYLNKSIGKVFIGTALQCTALYIWPLVFLKRRVFSSIYEGFAFLVHKPRESFPLILLIILTSTIKLLATLSLIYIFQSKNLLLMYGIGYVQNIINGYIGLIIFSMATMRLVQDESAIRDAQAQEK